MILNPSTSTRIALFILTVICFQTASHTQTLNTIRNGTPGSGVWMGNNGLAPWVLGKGDDCYRITTSDQGQGGAVWYNHPINFNNPFTISYQAYFGLNQSGGDGMALVFKSNNNNELGSTGEGIGYGGISPSMIFEFDTYGTAEKGILVLNLMKITSHSTGGEIQITTHLQYQVFSLFQILKTTPSMKLK
ncbi:hypothetical protein FORMB_09550 [Formosa sp. Hel1_33_131]|uniref:lectin-like domain-containing protein n=1 Tax=Formosa sp. Hel1_33_131 TaxID=1336794 RepID=UPI00084E261D|nr:hypothetical protein [Formosa sp. Hel1_33_131]AOR28005.1 hypothetical protein FORMB_09550 [Formosa sp. Hel1_33_131]